jgi:arylsulfatase A-like enzyme
MLYDEVMHVPLLLLGTRVPEGLRVPDPAGLVDLVPTLLEMAGVPAPDGLNGRSLTPALRGRPLAPRPQIAEVRGSLGEPNAPEPNLRAVWLHDRKVIRDLAHDRWEVFDLRADPEETTNLAETEPAAIEAARAVLARYDRLGTTPAGLPVVTPEAVDRFRALGYVD